MLREALKDKGDYAWIAPTYGVSERGIDALKAICPRQIAKIRGNKPHYAELINGSRLWYLSGDNPEGILGFGFKGAVVDEAARIDRNVLYETILPTLSDHQGWLIAVSTPKGRGWFFDWCAYGVDDQYPDYTSWHFPSNSSPHFAQEEWELMQRQLPEVVFRQEYMAEFIEDSAGVFRGVLDCTRRPDWKPSGSGPYVTGCDVAKHQDFTVLITLDAITGDCVDFQRFNQIDWPFQKARIIETCNKWDSRLIIDSTGVGDGVYDDLKYKLGNILPYRLTNTSKAALIQQLMISIEQGKLAWPGEWEVLSNELQRYEYELTAAGNVRYNAPRGYHDDAVIALGMANHGLQQTIQPFIFC